jgi:prepilin-type N-terminal cleavage/methylation domain-containing protein
MRRLRKDGREGGFTLTEVLTALVLLAFALLPVMKALISSQQTGTRSKRVTQAVFLADRKIEDIRAAALASFATDFSVSSEALPGGFACTVQDGQESAELKSIRVLVGFDDDGDGVLDGNEIDVVLNTLIASRQ